MAKFAVRMDRERDDQPRLPMDLPDRQRRRRRGRARQAALARERHQGELLSQPVLQTCGFCGNRQTVFEEVGVCNRCGGIMVRLDAEEEV